MPRGVNFNGFQPHHRRSTAQQMVDLMRAMGMTDDQIRAAVLAQQEKDKQAKAPAPEATSLRPE